MNTILVTNKDGFNFLEKISRNNNHLYIDGTVYDSCSGMNFSCAGIKLNSLNIFLEEPEHEDKEISTSFGDIFLKDEKRFKHIPNNMQIWIDNQVIEDLKLDNFYKNLEIIVVDLEKNLFYAEKIE